MSLAVSGVMLLFVAWVANWCAICSSWWPICPFGRPFVMASTVSARCLRSRSAARLAMPALRPPRALSSLVMLMVEDSTLGG